MLALGFETPLFRFICDKDVCNIIICAFVWLAMSGFYELLAVRHVARGARGVLVSGTDGMMYEGPSGVYEALDVNESPRLVIHMDTSVGDHSYRVFVDGVETKDDFIAGVAALVKRDGVPRLVHIHVVFQVKPELILETKIYVACRTEVFLTYNIFLLHPRFASGTMGYTQKRSAPMIEWRLEEDSPYLFIEGPCSCRVWCGNADVLLFNGVLEGTGDGRLFIGEILKLATISHPLIYVMIGEIRFFMRVVFAK